MSERMTDALCLWFCILFLLYADDTIIVSEDPVDFQECMNSFLDYCAVWKLHINFNNKPK